MSPVNFRPSVGFGGVAVGLWNPDQVQWCEFRAGPGICVPEGRECAYYRGVVSASVERVIPGVPLTTEEVNPVILDFVSQLITALRAIIGI
ncbi:hypothetical protein [Nocardia farcinica]